MGTGNRRVFGCPSCGARVSGSELACPRCGVLFTNETKLECPFCGVLVPRNSATCPSCGIDLSLPEEKPVEATLDELFDQIIVSETQKAHEGGKRFGCPNCSYLLVGTEDKCPNCSHEFTKVNQVECPICGALIPSSSKKCPECHRALVSLDELAELANGQNGEEPEKRTGEEIFFPELESEPGPPEPVGPPPPPEPVAPTTSEVSLAICPVCGGESPQNAPKCPHCGTHFEPFEEEPVPEPPEDKTVLVADEAVVALDSLLEAAGDKAASKKRTLKPAKADTTKVRHHPDRDAAGRLGKVDGTGFINGKHAGQGAGVTNGTGLVNGSGAVNGLGAVNGVSLVNGRGASNGVGIRSRPRQKSVRYLLTQWRFLAVVIALMMVIPVFYIMTSMRPSGEYEVDGDFQEWADLQSYPAQVASDSAAINIEEWSAVFYEGDFYFYIQTQSNAMAGPLVESFCIFIDADGSASTGYLVDRIGAEYRILLEGWNGTVRSSSVSHYGSSTDQLDWNSWMSAGVPETALFGNEIEGRARLSDVSSPTPEVVLISKDEAENFCFSAPIPLGGSLLIVDQEPFSEIAASGLVGLGAEVGLLRLSLSALGGTGTVSSISPEVLGCELASTFQPTEIAPGSNTVYEFNVDTSSGSATQLVSATVSEAGIDSTFDGVLVIGAGARAYLLEPPAEVAIDGAFADWDNRTAFDADFIPVQYASVDIVETGASNTSQDAFFYISVRGEMCCGSYLPRVCAKPVPGGGGIYIPTRKTAEDLARVYIDTDQSSMTGMVISHLSQLIGADRMIEVRGVFGRITSSALFEYASGSWVDSGMTVEAENDDKRLEIGVVMSSLGTQGPIDFIFEATSWNGRTDLAIFDPDAMSASALSGTLQGSKAWSIDSSVTPTTATAKSYQRKLFYDGTNFWSFYFDGTDTVHRYSSNGGQTWVDAGTVFTTSNVRNASIWHDSTSSLVYAVGDTSSASAIMYVQRGSVNPASHQITWAASDSTCTVSSNSDSSKLGYISKDANGYIWILGTNKTATQPARWDMTALRSSSTDSIASWSTTGSMLTTDKNDNLLFGTILPAGSGGNMWAVYHYGQKLAARQYTSGSWGSETVIYNGVGGSLDFSTWAPASALVDSGGVVHLVYGDNTKDSSQTTKPNIYYTHSSGSSWVTAVALDDVADTVGNRFPTLSLDTSTGDLYAFWIQMDNNYTICKKNVSGSWSFVDLGTQTSYTKAYLTSVYSAPGQSNICFMWTQNTSSPIEVMFDKIPEFGDLLAPTGFVLFAIVIMAGRSRRRWNQRQSR